MPRSLTPAFDDAQIAAVAEAAKLELRKRMRAVRSAHPVEALKARNRALVERASSLEVFENSRAIALFFPMIERKEVDLRELDAEARRRGKRVYYPFLEPRGDALVSGLRLTASLADLVDRGHRFLEPLPEAEQAARGDVDVVFVPALAVAPSRHRLGYGAGFYDSLLPDVCPPAQAVVVAYDFQLLADLPVRPHDVACDLIVTDARAL